MAFLATPVTGVRLNVRAAIRTGCAVVATCISAHAQTAATDAAPGNAISRDKSSAPAPGKEECVESHRMAQEEQNEGRLMHARELAHTCTALACPGLIISDCARWLNDLEQRIPSVVFEVRVDGEPNLSAVILADGQPVREWTRGEALRLDPGKHEFRVELGDFKPVTQKVLLAEGMRFRVVTTEFRTEKAASAAVAQPTTPATTSANPSQPVAPLSRPTPFIVYPLLGLGAAGIGSFALFALLGKSKQSDLENTCKPHCTDNDLRPMKTSYLIGDISLGVGLASLAAASVLYLGRPQERPPTAANIGFVPLPGGGAASASYSF